jgi:hypothetical protein
MYKCRVIKWKMNYGKEEYFLCTGASLYASYSLRLISNKFWLGGGEGGTGESVGEKL